MSNLEKIEDKSILGQLKDIEDAGILHVKGYSYHEIASLLSITTSKVKEHIGQYRAILQNRADEDPYFLEKIQFNTIKALQEFDQISKEAWETVSIATDHGMVAARIQALKLAADIAAKKAQLHKLIGASTSTDNDYIARMQKAEHVNQILSKILRDVISKHPSIAEEVRRELAVAFEIMDPKEDIVIENNED
jgi:predicted transcriptional regulator